MCLLASILLLPAALQGQVSVGSVGKPVAGALLELKDDKVHQSGATARGALALPRVEIAKFEADASNLATTITGAGCDTCTWEVKEHTGMIVFNTKADAPDVDATGDCVRGAETDIAPIYVWTGTEWHPMRPKAYQYSFRSDSAAIMQFIERNWKYYQLFLEYDKQQPDDDPPYYDIPPGLNNFTWDDFKPGSKTGYAKWENVESPCDENKEELRLVEIDLSKAKENYHPVVEANGFVGLTLDAVRLYDISNNLLRMEGRGQETEVNLGPFPNLRHFYASNNGISLDISLSGYGMLETLDVSNNKITKLLWGGDPVVLASQLRFLKKVNVENNDLPQEVLDAIRNAIVKGSSGSCTSNASGGSHMD
ncbi:leucine-rich repeat domain-containing protein [Dysgonomonas sp. 511]|nr:leucine-rich repeat domain-containing protein [Dysgonomonas sp. 511]